jgi:hypothetical protein
MEVFMTMEYRKSQLDCKNMFTKREYKEVLPKELEPYHYYVLDGGHAIMCVLECHLKEAQESSMDNYEIPVPVKYVLRNGWRKEGDYIIVDAPYELPYGLIVDNKYSEY